MPEKENNGSTSETLLPNSFPGIHQELASLWKTRKEQLRSQDDPTANHTDFEEFLCAPDTEGRSSLHQFYAKETKNTPVQHSPFERGDNSVKQITLFVRPLTQDDEPPYFASLPHAQVETFMVVYPDRGVMATTGSPAPTDNDIQTLKHFIDLAKEQTNRGVLVEAGVFERKLSDRPISRAPSDLIKDVETTL